MAGDRTANIGLAYTGDAVANANLNRIDTEIGALKGAAAPPSPIPPGGTTGQVLAKKSDADGDVEWIDLPAPAGRHAHEHGHH